MNALPAFNIAMRAATGKPMARSAIGLSRSKLILHHFESGRSQNDLCRNPHADAWMMYAD
jgi:hypothetical protein